MSEFRFITSSDEHLADLSPGLRKDNYRDAILDKITWQGDFARLFNADAVLRGGDFFHIKAANKTTMATMALAANIHRQYPCKTFSISGNHDMGYGSHISTIPKQPLGVFFNSQVFNQLEDELFFDNSMSVRVIGVNYTTDLDHEGLVDLLKNKSGNTYTIAVIHTLAAFSPDEKIQSFFGEKIFDYRDLVFDGCPDVYVFGHYHKDQGVVDHLGVKFINVGAVSRGALTFENLERKPKIASIVLNSQGISVEEHVVPHLDALQVFDLEKKQQLERERKSIDDFISKLRLDSESTSINNYLEELRNSDYSQDLKNLVYQILETAEAGVLEE